MPIEVTQTCDICGSRDEICVYTVTPEVGRAWQSMLCITHDKPMKKFQAKGTPVLADTMKGSRMASLDRMVRGLPRQKLDHRDSEEG